MPRALIIDDDEAFRTVFVDLVAREGFAISQASTIEEARARFREDQPDVVLTDLRLGDGKGTDLFDEMEAGRRTEMVVITGHASVDTAVEALRKGASDYLTKPVDMPRLKAVLSNVRRATAFREEVASLRRELRSLGHFGPLIGSSAEMQKVFDLIGRVAPTDATVLITGESGTGKELVAHTVHNLSRRRTTPFLPINCGAISHTLIESELFGHERGSFTGADRMHQGLFERASGGTIFLDEITEMPMESQVKLLRALETGTIMRVGGEQPISVDVRVIAASNRQPEEAIAEGRLREDLFYRLNVFPIWIPPLRSRPGDVELLAQHFLAELNRADGGSKTFTGAALRRLRAHDWPGNVRELKNLVQRRSSSPTRRSAPRPSTPA